MKGIFALSVLAISISACAGIKAPYEPLEHVPASFLSQHPSGSQVRKSEDIQRIFESNEKRFYQLYTAALKRDPTIQGDVTLAVAIETDGTVRAVGLAKSDVESNVFEQAVMKITLGLNFGPASGEGLYVFWYPLRFF